MHSWRQERDLYLDIYRNVQGSLRDFFLRTKRNTDELTVHYARGIPNYALMNIGSSGKTSRTTTWRVEPSITANKPKRVITTVTGNFPG